MLLPVALCEFVCEAVVGEVRRETGDCVVCQYCITFCSQVCQVSVSVFPADGCERDAGASAMSAREAGESYRLAIGF